MKAESVRDLVFWLFGLLTGVGVGLVLAKVAGP